MSGINPKDDPEKRANEFKMNRLQADMDFLK